MSRYAWGALLFVLGGAGCFPEPPECGPSRGCPTSSDPCLEAVCEANRCIERPNDLCGGDATDAVDAEVTEVDVVPDADAEVVPEADTDPEAESRPDVDPEPEPETVADPEVEPAPEVVPDSEAETLDVEVENTPEVETEVDAATDTNEPETTLDTGPDVEVEPEIVDPCPGGCGHLDEACKVGVCGEGGCEAIDEEGPCDDGQACTTDDRCEAGACVGDAVVCEAIDDCHIAGVCNPANGICSEPTKGNGATCDDGDACTEGEACQAGVCTGGDVPDDSSDWLARTSATFGPNELVVADDGSTWWFVSLTTEQTLVGTDTSGSQTTVSLPAGATAGIAAVQYDRTGRVQRALLLAHSEHEVRLFGGDYAPARVVTDPLFGESLLVVAGTFKTSMTTTVLHTSTSGAPRSFFVGHFTMTGSPRNFSQLEYSGFTETILDYKAHTFPRIATGPDGQYMIVVAVASDTEASVVGRAQFRAAPGQHAIWFLRFNAQGLLWERVLAPRDTSSFVLGLFPTVASDGTTYFAGLSKGLLDIRRKSEPAILGTIDAGVGSLLVFKASPTADFEVVGQFNFGLIGGSTANRTGGVTFLILSSAGLSYTKDNSSVVIAADPPGTSSEFYLAELDSAGNLGITARNPTPSIRSIASGPHELVICAYLPTTLLVGGNEILSPLPATSHTWLHGVSTDATWTIPLNTFSVAPTLVSSAYGVGHDGAVAVSGGVTSGTLRIGDSGPTINAGEGYVARINSENGQVCGQR